MHKAYAVVPVFPWLHWQPYWLSINPQLCARVWIMITGEDPNQSRLPRSVLPNQGMHLCALNRECDVLKRPRASEGLREVLELQPRAETSDRRLPRSFTHFSRPQSFL